MAPPRKAPKIRTARQKSDRTAQTTTGSVDAIAFLIALIVGDTTDAEPWQVALAASSVAVPLALATCFVWKCNEWTEMDTRCNRTRRGFGRRCHHHRGLVLADWMAALSFTIAGLNLILVLR